MPELTDGCVQAAKGPIMPESEFAAPGAGAPLQEVQVFARVGQEAPDFEATAFVAGAGFRPVKLSDYKGKWVVVCFYPGDFTFV